MSSDFMPGITSVSSNALLLSSTVRLLHHVETLPSGSTGALAFGDDGVILIEKKRVCWAMASEMRQRLTDILCEQHEPPLERSMVEQVFRRCKQDGTPMGEALVAGGLVSEADLRAALLRHTCEAIVRLAQGRATTPTHFAQHEKGGYDPRFVFTTTELLASLSGKRRVQLADEARRHLATLVVPDVSAFAFLSEPMARQAVIIAVAKGCELAVGATLELARWATRTFDIASQVDKDARVVAATWSDRITLLTWRDAEIGYVAVCATRAASALLLSRLALRATSEGERARATTSERKDGP
jgi:hypothetical protein